MVISVVEQFDDHEIKQYFIDSKKLNPDNYVDKLILKKINNKSINLRIDVEAYNWEEDEKFDGEIPEVSGRAICKAFKPDKVLYLKIDFE